jgi:hypothetical protein
LLRNNAYRDRVLWILSCLKDAAVVFSIYCKFIAGDNNHTKDFDRDLSPVFRDYSQ